ncbi:Hypothetical protein POVN_LOCUS396 [uncultured virus]|nr:Hypothetical protein POVN_LOCUS396 [uncultured virus]
MTDRLPILPTFPGQRSPDLVPEIKLPSVPEVVGVVRPEGYTGGAGAIPPFVGIPGLRLPLPIYGQPAPMLPLPQEQPQEFSLYKGKPRILDDDQVEQIFAGWDWFFEKELKEGQAPTSLEDMKDKVQVVRGGAIQDNSCFYHSVLKALVSTYQEAKRIVAYADEAMKKSKYIGNLRVSTEVGRQIFADTFRRGIAQWLLLPAIKADGSVYTEQEATIYLNTTPQQIDDLLENGVALDPERAQFDQFRNRVTTTLNYFTKKGDEFVNEEKKLQTTWEANMVERYYSPDEKTHNEAALELATYTVRGEDVDAPIAEAIQALKAELGDAKFYTDETIQAIAQLAAPAAAFDGTAESVDAYLASKSGKVGNTRFSLSYESILALKREFADTTVAFSRVTELVGGEPTLVPAERNPYYHTYNYLVSSGINDPRNLSAAAIVIPLGLEQPRPLPPRGQKPIPPLTPAQLAYRTYLIGYIDRIKFLTRSFRNLFRDPSKVQFRPYPAPVRNMVLKDPQAFVALLQRSIFPGVTPHFFTTEEINALLTRDLRVGKIDDAQVLALPININYFMVNDGLRITKYNESHLQGRESAYTVEYPYQLSVLLQYILPRWDPKDRRIVRRDAGLTDVVPIMPYILGVNIYIVEVYGDRIHVHSEYPGEPIPDAPSIVINWTGNHFEPIGTADEKGVVKTTFEPDDIFLLAVKEYVRRREASPTPATFEKTLAVAKVPEHKGPLGPYARSRGGGMPSLPELLLPSAGSLLPPRMPGSFIPLPQQGAGGSAGAAGGGVLRLPTPAGSKPAGAGLPFPGAGLMPLPPLQLPPLGGRDDVLEATIQSLMETDPTMDRETAAAIAQASASPPRLMPLPRMGGGSILPPGRPLQLPLRR